MKKTIAVPVLVTLIVLTLGQFSCSDQIETVNDEATPQQPNIILLIADGMGLSQLSAAYYYGEQEPVFSSFPGTGFIHTASASHKITDSGAGATAFASGIRTFNGGIGVGPDSSAVASIPELLSSRGYLSGLIATCQVTHATPAAFFAHHADREKQFAIASQLHRSPIHFVAAGGYGYFKTERTDYLDSLRAKGFSVDTTGTLLEGSYTNLDRVAVLSGKWSMPSMEDGRGDFSVRALNSALRYFKQRGKNFFLMVEGSQIDWGGHDNDAGYLIGEMLDFEKVVRAAYTFAKEDGNTLVVVVADHETGGFTLSGKMLDSTAYEYDYNSLVPSFSTGGHSAALIPVMAFGPGAEKFTGIYSNTAIFSKIMELVP